LFVLPAGAAEELRLSEPTISNQLKTLEGALGHHLFEQQGVSSCSRT
jgi:DNA-binding transcriptional LysR family regulator